MLKKTLAKFVAAVALAGIFLAAVPAKANQAPPPNSPNFQAYETREVRHQLVMQPFYNVFDNLQFQVEGSKIILLGQVTNPTLKSSAEKSVKSIEGVTAVENKIEVLPPSPMDDQIRRAVFRAIYSFPSLQMYAIRSVPPIHIIVNTGHVTLEGSVAKQADKDVAGIRANSVPGIFSVTNNLQVDNGK